MKILNLPKKLLIGCLVLTIANFLTSCEKENLSEQSDEISNVNAKVKAADEEEEEEEATGNNAIFPHSYQGFNHEIAPWGDMESPQGNEWCGEIQLKSKKDSELNPSAGQGYATVKFGQCASPWNAVPDFVAGSGPATLDESLFSQTWPESGFVHQLDIYLDPSTFDEGPAFVLFFSIYYYYDENVYPHDYFGINVDKAGEKLIVNGEYEVQDAGWFTFKQVYDKNDEGKLMASFELLRNHKNVYSTDLAKTVSDTPTSDFDIDEIYAEGNILGSGYMWFPYIASGVELPIDEYRLHAGK